MASSNCAPGARRRAMPADLVRNGGGPCHAVVRRLDRRVGVELARRRHVRHPGHRDRSRDLCARTHVQFARIGQQAAVIGQERAIDRHGRSRHWCRARLVPHIDVDQRGFAGRQQLGYFNVGCEAHDRDEDVGLADFCWRRDRDRCTSRDAAAGASAGEGIGGGAGGCRREALVTRGCLAAAPRTRSCAGGDVGGGPLQREGTANRHGSGIGGQRECCLPHGIDGHRCALRDAAAGTGTSQCVSDGARSCGSETLAARGRPGVAPSARCGAGSGVGGGPVQRDRAAGRHGGRACRQGQRRRRRIVATAHHHHHHRHRHHYHRHRSLRAAARTAEPPRTLPRARPWTPKQCGDAFMWIPPCSARGVISPFQPRGHSCTIAPLYARGMRLGFEHTYAALPPAFHTDVQPAAVPAPSLLVWNDALGE